MMPTVFAGPLSPLRGVDEELLGEGEGTDQRCMCLGRDLCVFVHTRVIICGPKTYSDM